MTSPSFIATTAIQPYRAVKSSSMGQGSPATLASDTIIGVTGPLVTTQGSRIAFQDGKNGMFRLAAGSPISSGNIVCPSTNGSFVAAAASGEFIALDNASPGETFIAMKTVRMNSSQMMTVLNPANASTPVVYPYRALGFLFASTTGSLVEARYAVSAVSNPCSYDFDDALCLSFAPTCGIADSSVYATGQPEHALAGMKPSFQEYETVQVQLADAVSAGDKLMRKFNQDGLMSPYPVNPVDIVGDENRPYIAVALQSGSAGDVIWAILGGSMRHRAT